MDFNSIFDAKKRIEKYLFNTPIIRLEQLDDYVGCKVFIKAENMQLTNSFKIRGALNKFLKFKDDLQGGVVATSSGSHGIAVAYAANLLNIPATIILRDSSPDYKQMLIKQLGAEVITLPYNLRQIRASEIVKEKLYTYVHPYEDEDIIEGHGTLGIDIINQGEFDKIVIPMGGGGLAAGLSTAVKTLIPKCKIIGCEPSVIGKFNKSIKKGRPIEVEFASSIADALLPLRPGKLPFPYIKSNMDYIIPVDENNIIKAEKILLNKGKIISEISSAIVLGAALQMPSFFNKNEKVCFVISGGNIDIEHIQKISSDQY